MPRLTSNGIEIEYDTFGDPSGEPLLLIMGLGSQMVLWHEDYCAEFADRGHYVVRFDNRDIGKSTYLSHLGQPDLTQVITAVLSGGELQPPYRLEDMADDTVGVLDALGIERAHVFGVSMGGMIAQTVALRAPQRVKSLTSMMSSTGDRDLPPPKAEALTALMQPPATDKEGAIQRGINVFRAIGSPAYPMDEAFMRERGELQFERGYNPDGMLRQLCAILAQEGRRERLRRLDLPALVIHGVDDPLVPVECGQATAEAIPGAELLLLDGMGHDQPRELWPTIIDAVSRLTARAA